MKNKIEDLRDHLFAELADLRNPDKKYDKDRTHAVVEVAQTIINSAKAETEFVNVAQGMKVGTGFLAGTPEPQKPALTSGSKRPPEPENHDGKWMK